MKKLASALLVLSLLITSIPFNIAFAKSTCQHWHQIFVNKSAPEYRKNSGDDERHTVIYYGDWKCDECNEIVETNWRYTESKKHDFYHFSNTVEKCRDCGYEITVECPHYSISGHPVDDFVYRQIAGNERLHIRSAHYRRQCNDCGVILAENEYNESDDLHDFYYYSNTVKKCRDCGYEITVECPHYSKSGHRVDDWAYRQIAGDKECHIASTHYQWQCNDCGVILAENEYDESKELHDFRQSATFATCRDCGYQIDVACSHESQYRSNYELAYQQISGDDTKHNAITYYDMLCSVCDEVLKKRLEELDEENHSFDGTNKCADCGYQLKPDKPVQPTPFVCPHKNTNNVKNGDTYYDQLPNDMTYHQAITPEYTICSDCNEVLKENVVSVKHEVHAFSKDGMCTKCYCRLPEIPPLLEPGQSGAYYVPHNGGSYKRTVQASKSWNIQTTASWIHVSPLSGRGNGSWGFTVDSNTGPVRSGTIYLHFESYSSPITIDVIQLGNEDTEYYLTVDQGHINGLVADVSGGRGATINVSSNVSWKATENMSWVSLDNTSGSGKGKFTVYVEANTGSAREGYITVSGEHCNSISIRVYQPSAGGNKGNNNSNNNPAPVCSHVYTVRFDKPISGSGVWADNGNGTHKRTQVKYQQICTKCGTQGPDHVEYNDVPSEPHNYSEASKTVNRYLKSDENGHKVVYDITKVCKAKGCGATLTSKKSETEEHDFDANGKCACGYSRECKTHIDKNQNQRCDICEAYLPFASNINSRVTKIFDADGYVYMQLMEGNVFDIGYTAWYASYSQQLEALGNLSLKQMAESSGSIHRIVALNMSENVQNDLMAKIIVDYIYNFDVEDALNNITEKEQIKIIEVVNQNIVPFAKKVGITEGTIKMFYKWFVESDCSVDSLLVKFESAGMTEEKLVSKGLSVSLKVLVETAKNAIDMIKADIVRERIHSGIGGTEYLPEDVQKEIDNVLYEMQSGILATLDMGVTIADYAGTQVLDKALLNCPLLKGAHLALSAYTSGTDYEKIGAGIEDIYAVKVMTQKAEELFKEAFEQYQNNPSEENWKNFVHCKETLRTYIKIGVAVYRDWSIREAKDEFDWDVWNHSEKAENRIREANKLYENEITTIDDFFKIFD